MPEYDVVEVGVEVFDFGEPVISETEIIENEVVFLENGAFSKYKVNESNRE